jgi:hypothetical protein
MVRMIRESSDKSAKYFYDRLVALHALELERRAKLRQAAIMYAHKSIKLYVEETCGYSEESASLISRDLGEFVSDVVADVHRRFDRISECGRDRPEEHYFDPFKDEDFAEVFGDMRSGRTPLPEFPDPFESSGDMDMLMDDLTKEVTDASADMASSTGTRLISDTMELAEADLSLDELADNFADVDISCREIAESDLADDDLTDA